MIKHYRKIRSDPLRLILTILQALIGAWITGIVTGNRKLAYYCVDFNQTNNGAAAELVYQALIKVSDIMKQNISGNGL